MLIRVPSPYDFARSVERFHLPGVDPANVWDGEGLHRVICGKAVRITAAEGGVDVEPFDPAIGKIVERLLGFEHDLDGFVAWSAGRPVLGEIVENLRGFRPPTCPDPFESLVGAITSQLISLTAACAIRGRMVRRYGEQIGPVYAFPSRDRMALVPEEDLVALGFSRRKAEYVIGLARADIDLDALADLDDAPVRGSLTAIRGLGVWSAEWFLARHLVRPRAWPVGDLALHKAVDLFYGVDIIELGEQLDPFQNLAAHYLLTAMRTP